MTWMKVDDRLHANRKARVAGLPAMGLWLLTGSWAADTLSDGFVPATQPWAWAGSDAAELAGRLVDAGLWLPTEQLGEQGWMFHDWHDYQPMRADVLAKRESDRERMRRWRSKRHGVTNGERPGSGIASKENPYPDVQRESRRDSDAHDYNPSDLGLCIDCALPESNRRHR